MILPKQRRTINAGIPAENTLPAMLRSWWTLAPLLCIVACIGVVSIAFRTFSFRMYSSLPTGFDGPMVFRQRYLLEHGEFLVQKIPTFSYWSDAVNARLGSYLMELINAGILHLSSSIAIPPSIIHQIVLTIPLVGLAWFLLVRGHARQQRVAPVAIVAAVVTLGTPVVINFLTGWNVAYGWIILLGVTAVYTSDLPPMWKTGLTILFTIISPPLYHSFGFLLVTYVCLLWLLSVLLGERSVIVSPRLVVVYYLTYQMYVSTLFFGALMDGLRDVVTLSFLKRDTPVIALSSIKMGVIDVRYLNALLYVLLSIPIGCAVMRCVTYIRKARTGDVLKRDADTRLLIATTALTVAITVFAVLFGFKFSIEFLINRGAMYVIIAAVLAIIYELRTRGPRYRYVYVIATLCVVMSVYIFSVQSTTSHSATHVSIPEEQGYGWLKERLEQEDVVFTDFRLSGPFIADGFFRVLGITGEGNEQTRPLLNSIYYESSAENVTHALDQVKTYRDDRSANYLFLSTGMTHDYPGLNGYSSRFEPVPHTFFQVLDDSRAWELIYRNEDVRIYHRRDR
jgi:hypothetical protein